MSKIVKNWKMTSGPSPEPDDDEALRDLMRSEFVIEAYDRAALGKPRVLLLEGLDRPFVRLAQSVDRDEQDARRGASDRRDGMAVNRLIGRLGEIKSLAGPSNTHAVDELAAALFEEAHNFAPAVEAIRRSAQVNIRRGARWLQFRPLVIESTAGAGKTRFVHRLAAHSGLKLVYLDCATMTNMSPIVSQDASWSGARHSEVMEGLANSTSANLIVCLDELDKIRDFGRHASPRPSESLVGLFEKQSAASHLDNYLQLAVDLSFINWVVLVNDLSRISQPLLDRCQVIRLAPPSPKEIAHIASLEIERRGLDPELVDAINAEVRRGKITSLRTLHKLLEVASAASSRPILN
nr:AAA family ATPase [uncultured Devosia sp.]